MSQHRYWPGIKELKQNKLCLQSYIDPCTEPHSHLFFDFIPLKLTSMIK